MNYRLHINLITTIVFYGLYKKILCAPAFPFLCVIRFPASSGSWSFYYYWVCILRKGEGSGRLPSLEISRPVPRPYATWPCQRRQANRLPPSTLPPYPSPPCRLDPIPSAEVNEAWR